MGWFIYGTLIGGGITGLAWGLNAANASLAWYVWLLISLALVMFTLTIQHYVGSIREQEPIPARRGAMALGLPGVVLAIAAIVLAFV
ncbi:dehalogenase [Chloroflexota bacterium]